MVRVHPLEELERVVLALERAGDVGELGPTELPVAVLVERAEPLEAPLVKGDPRRLPVLQSAAAGRPLSVTVGGCCTKHESIQCSGRACRGAAWAAHAGAEGGRVRACTHRRVVTEAKLLGRHLALSRRTTILSTSRGRTADVSSSHAGAVMVMQVASFGTMGQWRLLLLTATEIITPSDGTDSIHLPAACTLRV